VPHPPHHKPHPPHHHPKHPSYCAPCAGEERIGRTGKVVGLMHDRFGDFEGFVLLDECGVEHLYCSREHSVERLVRGAWTERAVITVFSPRQCPNEPAAIVVRRAPEPFQH
jgi:hypothetical protein